jgi:hypothetical protein
VGLQGQNTSINLFCPNPSRRSRFADHSGRLTGKSAIEVNPLFATLTKTNILAFIGLKILTVLFTSFMFLGATRIAKAPSSNFIGKYFISSASIASCFVMTAAVANNILVILKIP